MRLTLLVPVLALLVACSDARGRDAAAPQRVEVTLGKEDRAWLEALLEREFGRREPLAPRATLAAVVEPVLGGVEPATWQVPVDTKMRLVDDGPVALATYNGGAKMYEGGQIETDAGWVRHGPWQAWHADGSPWEAGTYFEGEEHGLWEWWYENGNAQARGDYDLGARVGAWIYYHENGTVMAQGSYDHDRPIGVWSVFDEQGALVSETDHDAPK